MGDVMAIKDRIVNDEIIDMDENIKLRFNDAGYMLGSIIIEIWIK